MRHLAVLFVSLMGLVLPAHAEELKPRIAVLEIKGSLSRGQLSILSDKIRSGILLGVQGKDFVVMSRENTAVLLKDMGLDCEKVQGECEVETGRNIGAAYVVSGSVEDVGRGMMLLSLKIHDTKTGALKAAGDVRGEEVIDMVDLLQAESAKLMRQALGGGGQGGGAPVPVTPVAPSQAQYQLNFGGGGGGLDIAAKLKEQKCVRQAEQQGGQAREKRMADAIKLAQSKASQAWQARTEELQLCTRLERSKRDGCISAVEQWLSVARAMKVDLPSGVESVQTDCGQRQPAYPADSRVVQAKEVGTAENLLARLRLPGGKAVQQQGAFGALKTEVARLEDILNRYGDCPAMIESGGTEQGKMYLEQAKMVIEAEEVDMAPDIMDMLQMLMPQLEPNVKACQSQ